jgi:hypothetical protein
LGWKPEKPTGNLYVAVLVFLSTAAGGLAPLQGQSFELRPAPELVMPAAVDSNSPAFWRDGKLHLLNSIGLPFLSVGEDQFDITGSPSSQVWIDNLARQPIWIESVWQRADGSIYAWYHHEVIGACPDSGLSFPVIGALVSRDGGASFEDLGIILASGDALRCDAQNGYFAGGHGDFSVILDRAGKYFYFFFGNYGGDPASQGVAVARMSIEDLDNPVGAVWKYYQGEWSEPGLGGRVTPVFPVRTPWEAADTDAFWGPSIHWNTYLKSYVMLLNRACCSPGWPQEGVYISFHSDLATPDGWSAPAAVLRSDDLGYGLGYYPQVLGVEPGESDTLAGQIARFYLQGVSDWEIIFQR